MSHLLNVESTLLWIYNIFQGVIIINWIYLYWSINKDLSLWTYAIFYIDVPTYKLLFEDPFLYQETGVKKITITFIFSYIRIHFQNTHNTWPMIVFLKRYWVARTLHNQSKSSNSTKEMDKLFYLFCSLCQRSSGYWLRRFKTLKTCEYWQISDFTEIVLMLCELQQLQVAHCPLFFHLRES